MSEIITGAEALLKSLVAEGVDLVFGYPGGQILPVYDKLYDYQDKINHILTRHEQGAIHAAQGFARVTNRPGVVIVTSGPGAANLITGLSDAQMDSTPLVVISGQVSAKFLGSDAFQETDVVGITQPITKWALQVRRAVDIPAAVARAFYIASTGRPGPVVLDIARDAQVGEIEWSGYKKLNFIRSYNPRPKAVPADIVKAANIINSAQRPLILAGHGVMISGAEEELRQMAEKGGIPVASTLLGLSNMPSGHPLYKGMLGMHGNIGPNYLTNSADAIIAIGMRFDDRITGDTNRYAKQAKIIHIDIDSSEFNRNVKVDHAIQGDARDALMQLIPLIEPAKHAEWLSEFDRLNAIEDEKVKRPELQHDGPLTMGETVKCVSDRAGGDAILVTDVGQNQMMAARYFSFSKPRSIVTSGGLGTMGFGLPAAIGAKMGAPERTVCYFSGDGGFQMTIEELGTIMQHGTAVKMIVLNNSFLGNVRQWQELFYGARFSQTPMLNPNFCMIARAYGIEAEDVDDREGLSAAVERMLKHNGPYMLNVRIASEGMVFPMIPAGQSVVDIMLSREERFSC
ncbi:MAG: biosynthetic-type acetolactate synthase large subunit [Lachnospiraceae bacterium]|nr:biosynthetic-type acetolactate synthase large subunit [Lachnospiraceae bacterium]